MKNFSSQPNFRQKSQPKISDKNLRWKLRRKSQTKVSDENLRQKSQTKIPDENLRRKSQMKISDKKCLKWFPLGIRQYWYGDSKMTRNQFSVDGFRKHLTLRPQKHKKKQFWKHFTILQGSPKRWKIGVAETLTEYYCGSLFKVCNTETKYTLKLSSASRASRGAIFSKKKRIS